MRRNIIFNDGRSKRVILIAHCLLNQSAISDGTVVYPAALKDAVDFFLNADVSIVQMSCPEFCYLGLDRGNIHGADSPVVVEDTRACSAMKNDSTNMKLPRLTDYVVQQIIEYKKYGSEIIGIIGADRPPNCGVETTSDNSAEINGMGLFVEKTVDQFLQENMSVLMIGIRGTDNIQEKPYQLVNRELQIKSGRCCSSGALLYFLI